MTVVAIHLASDYNVGANFLRAFSAAVVANDADCWEGHWAFWVAALFGSLLAVLCYGVFSWLGRPDALGKKIAPK
jgi:glycerol uptake facilitator-like aquaporin